MTKNIYEVHFLYARTSDGWAVWCCNMATADNAEQVREHYAKYEKVMVIDSNDGELKTAERKGMPITRL